MQTTLKFRDGAVYRFDSRVPFSHIKSLVVKHCKHQFAPKSQAKRRKCRACRLYIDNLPL